MGYETRYPSEPDEPFPDFDLSDIPDEEIDRPLNSFTFPPSSLTHGISPITIGCGPFSTIFGPSVPVSTFLRITRLALRYGITAFDTAPHYHPSEIILGKALSALVGSGEVKRGDYQIITKCGKYSPAREDHNLEGEVVRACVERSLRRFETDYIDVMYIHDVEFNSSLNPPSGNPLQALRSSPHYNAEYERQAGLAPDQVGKILGEGDRRILEAVGVLREMKREGKVRRIGISAYPLPTLLRISLLVLHQTGHPLDILQSYSHANLQNHSLPSYIPYFRTLAQVQIIMNASPLNMGLLTTRGPPDWHFAERGLRECVEGVKEGLEGVKIEELAVDWGMRELEVPGMEEGGEVTNARLPVVVGINSIDQIHKAVQSYLAVTQPSDPAQDQKLHEMEKQVRERIAKDGWADWSWESPTAGL